MIAKIESGLERIAHLPAKDLADTRGAFAAIEHQLNALSEACSDEATQGPLKEIAGRLARANSLFDQVYGALDSELCDAATGLDGVLFLLNGLDSEPVPASSLYCVLSPLVKQVDKAHDVFNQLTR